MDLTNDSRRLHFDSQLEWSKLPTRRLLGNVNRRELITSFFDLEPNRQVMSVFRYERFHVISYFVRPLPYNWLSLHFSADLSHRLSHDSKRVHVFLNFNVKFLHGRPIELLHNDLEGDFLEWLAEQRQRCCNTAAAISRHGIFLKSTIRLLFVPRELLEIPQQFDVLVNSC